MPLIKINREIGFVIGVAIYLIVLIIEGFGLSPDSLTFPVPIIVTAGVIIGLKWLIYKFPQLNFLDPKGNINSMIRGGGDQPPQEQEAPDSPSSIYEPIAFIIWLITFPLGIYLLGFMVTVGIWMFGFLFVISKIKLLKALLISGSTLAGIYIIFVGILKVHFPPGSLF
ncbi:MAG: tripartite tricarboxylate transporter TctB family protein [Thermodesulfobacteriota bacterium]|nr:tripartite tricarboxylate transporter TctB family protein [Thermodesulfobacteriota bacterium]